MTLTDEDLKRLKEGANDFPNERFIKGHDVLALIARLEAAEEFAEEARAHCKYDCNECGKVRDAWRKAAGK